MDYMAPHKKLLFFDYQPNRNQQVVHDVLGEYTGVLQTDGLNIYHEMDSQDQVITLGCWAHCRRKYREAQEFEPNRPKPVIDWIKKLYATEKKIRKESLTFEQAYTLRQKESVPVLDNIYQYLLEQKADPMLLEKHPMRKAINYTFSLWDKLKRYCDDGSYLIDNNPIENTIRPLVIARKNHLFAGSHQGAERLASIFSFTGSCKLNEINPQTYLSNVLSRIQDTKQSQLIDLLPHRWKENK